MVPFSDMNTEEMNDTDIADLSAIVDVDDEAGEPGIYEVGYHLAPTLSEDAVEKEAAAIAALVSKEGAGIIGERTPAQINLAYPIGKKIDGARQEFKTSYFGWVAFEVPASALIKIKETLDAHEHILRFIITKTSKDQVAAIIADPALDVGAPEPDIEVEAVVGADAEGEVVPGTEEEDKS